VWWRVSFWNMHLLPTGGNSRGAIWQALAQHTVVRTKDATVGARMQAFFS